MAVSTVIGALADTHDASAVIVVVAWGALAGMMVSLGQTGLVTGLQWVVAVLVVGAFTLTLPEAFVRGAFVLAGGLLQLLLVVVLWPFRSHPAERRSLRGVYLALAVLADGVAGGESLAPGGTALDEARAVLEDPQPLSSADEVTAFRSLLDEAERIRIRLTALARHVGQVPAVAQMASTSAVVLRAVAASLEEDREPAVPGSFPAELDAAVRSVADGAASSGVPEWVAADVRSSAGALAGQLRSVLLIASRLAGGGDLADVARPAGRAPASGRGRHERVRRRGRRSLDSLREALHTLRANVGWQSAVFRHAVRLSVALGIATLISRGAGLSHGYWIGLTVLVVLRPDFASTANRGVLRVVGTVVGALLASLLVAWLRPGSAGLIVLFGLASLGGYLFVRANYLVFSICVTSYVVFLLAFAGLPTGSTVTARLVDTLIGGGLALTMYLAWPTWESRLVGPQLAELFEAQADYSGAVLAVLADPSSDRRGRLNALRSAARVARTNAEASLARLESEPERSRSQAPIDVGAASGMLAAGRRFAVAALSLHVQVPERGEPGLGDVPALAELSRALGGRMRGNAARLRTLVPTSAAVTTAVEGARSVAAFGRQFVRRPDNEGDDEGDDKGGPEDGPADSGRPRAVAGPEGAEGEDRPARPVASLRELHGALEQALGASRPPDDLLSRLVVTETDVMVDSVNTVSELLRR